MKSHFSSFVITTTIIALLFVASSSVLANQEKENVGNGETNWITSGDEWQIRIDTTSNILFMRRSDLSRNVSGLVCSNNYDSSNANDARKTSTSTRVCKLLGYNDGEEYYAPKSNYNSLAGVPFVVRGLSCASYDDTISACSMSSAVSSEGLSCGSGNLVGFICSGTPTTTTSTTTTTPAPYSPSDGDDIDGPPANLGGIIAGSTIGFIVLVFGFVWWTIRKSMKTALGTTSSSGSNNTQFNANTMMNTTSSNNNKRASEGRDYSHWDDPSSPHHQPGNESLHRPGQVPRWSPFSGNSSPMESDTAPMMSSHHHQNNYHHSASPPPPPPPIVNPPPPPAPVPQLPGQPYIPQAPYVAPVVVPQPGQIYTPPPPPPPPAPPLPPR